MRCQSPNGNRNRGWRSERISDRPRINPRPRFQKTPPCEPPSPEENAVKTLPRFAVKFTSLIVAVLSCFDRVIFKGYLTITNGPALEGFVDHVLKIRRKDFMDFAEKQSEPLVNFAKRLAQEAGAEYHYLQGAHRKDKLVDKLLRQRPISDGLICVLCCMECCPSFKLIHAKDRPRLINAPRQQGGLSF